MISILVILANRKIFIMEMAMMCSKRESWPLRRGVNSSIVTFSKTPFEQILGISIIAQPIR